MTLGKVIRGPWTVDRSMDHANFHESMSKK